jgi:tRNA-(MS[2]IO[6]A)-hydroxylase (MiaE)-like
MSSGLLCLCFAGPQRADTLRVSARRRSARGLILPAATTRVGRLGFPAVSIRPRDLDDPTYRAGVIDLLGLLARGELSAFERLSSDAGMAPTLHDRAALAEMANAEYHHFEQLRDRLVDLGVKPEEAMAPFDEAFASFHDHTQPNDWLEGLVKAYIGDGIAADFYREVSAALDQETRDLVISVLDDTGHAGFVVDRVRAAIAADARVAGRLALWGRRLVGEALCQAGRTAAERSALLSLILDGLDRRGMELSELSHVFAQIMENHARRMASLGLAA